MRTEHEILTLSRLCNKRILLPLLLLLMSVFYTYGILTMYLKIFPFEQLQYFKNFVLQPTNSTIKNRELDTTGLTEIPVEELMNPLVFVTYGQSNSVNSSQMGYQNSDNVFMFLDGKIYQYREPAIGGTGENGSVWGRVGDQLIQNGLAYSVVFVNAGWGGASIQELTYEHQYDFFEKQLRSALDTFGKIDGVLFHQGETNHKRLLGSSNYERDFLHFVSKIHTITNTPIYLSTVSLCQSEPDKGLLGIQDKIIIENEGVLRGPNSDLLSEPKYRLPDYCHFSSEGLDRLSEMWVSSITNHSEK